MAEAFIEFGPWAPDHPAYGGNRLSGGGQVFLEDAKGVYHTLGGYRPLIGPGTLVGEFTGSQFPEQFTPNTMTAGDPILWLDDQDTSTMTLEPASPLGIRVSAWNNKLTGTIAGNGAAMSAGNPDAWSGGPDYEFNDRMTFSNATSSNSGIDIDLSAAHTGDDLWVMVYAGFFGNPALTQGDILIEFYNDGEDGADHADSLVIRRKTSGSDQIMEVFRNGETAAESTAIVSNTEYFMLFIQVDGTNKIVRLNGTQTDTELSSGAFNFTKMRIGAANDKDNSVSWLGWIREVVVGTTALSADDIEKIEGWLANKRAELDKLPSGHTYKASVPYTNAITYANEPTSTGLFWSRTGSAYMFVGDYDKIYLLNQATEAFQDVTNASTDYLATRDLPWQFAQFGNRVVAVSRNTRPQYFDLGVSTHFADLPGSPPAARAVAQVRDFIFLGSLNDGGIRENYRVRWSGFNDSEDWTTDPGGTQADFQDLDSGWGEVMAIVGGECATGIQQRAITRFTYVGPPYVFQRDTIEINRGTIAPHSVIQVGRLIYFYSHDGFYAFDGVTSQKISDDRLHRWVEARISDVTALQMRVEHDHERRIIVWSWPYDPSGADRETAGLLLVYNYKTGNWTYHCQTDLRWWPVQGPLFEIYIDIDVDDTLIDTSDRIIDSETGGYSRILGMNYDGERWRLSELDGGTVTARLETGKIAITPGWRSHLNGARVVGNIDSDTVLRVAAQSDDAYASNTLTTTSLADEYTHNLVEDGYVPLDSEGRYHGIRVEWDDGKGVTSGDVEELVAVQGIELEYSKLGRS